MTGDHETLFGHVSDYDLKPENWSPIEGAPDVYVFQGLVADRAADAGIDISFGGNPADGEADVPLDAKTTLSPTPGEPPVLGF